MGAGRGDSERLLFRRCKGSINILPLLLLSPSLRNNGQKMPYIAHLHEPNIVLNFSTHRSRRMLLQPVWGPRRKIQALKLHGIDTTLTKRVRSHYYKYRIFVSSYRVARRHSSTSQPVISSHCKEAARDDSDSGEAKSDHLALAWAACRNASGVTARRGRARRRTRSKALGLRVSDRARLRRALTSGGRCRCSTTLGVSSQSAYA